MSRALDISTVIAGVALDLLKTLAILSNKTVIRSAVEQEDLKPYWKSEVTFLELINKPIINKVFKDFTNHIKKSNKVIVLICKNISACLFSVYNKKFLTS